MKFILCVRLFCSFSLPGVPTLEYMSIGDMCRRVMDGLKFSGIFRTGSVRCGGCIVRNIRAGYRITAIVVAAIMVREI